MNGKLKILLLLALILISGCKKLTLRKVKKLSPVPVHFISIIDKDPNDGVVTTGQFHYTGNIGNKITVEKGMPTSNKIRSTLHEIKHAKCLSTFCVCYETDDEVLCEEHAFKFVLTWLLIHQQKDILKDEMIVLQERGEAEKLSEIREDDTFTDLIVEAGYCIEGFGVVVGYIGDGLADRFSRWSKLIGS